ncbi:MAG TPA: hypothetical protein VF263_12355 [Longimicrobiaceae bacterium]
MSTILNTKQSDVLRELSRRTAPVPEELLDGRVVRALESRGLVERRDEGVVLSEEGRAHFQDHVRRRRRATQHGAEADPRTARADAIRRAVDVLQLAVPMDADLSVGDVRVEAEELLNGLRRFAQQVERKAAAGA